MTKFTHYTCVGVSTTKMNNLILRISLRICLFLRRAQQQCFVKYLEREANGQEANVKKWIKRIIWASFSVIMSEWGLQGQLGNASEKIRLRNNSHSCIPLQPGCRYTPVAVEQEEIQSFKFFLLVLTLKTVQTLFILFEICLWMACEKSSAELAEAFLSIEGMKRGSVLL